MLIISARQQHPHAPSQKISHAGAHLIRDHPRRTHTGSRLVIVNTTILQEDIVERRIVIIVAISRIRRVVPELHAAQISVWHKLNGIPGNSNTRQPIQILTRRAARPNLLHRHIREIRARTQTIENRRVGPGGEVIDRLARIGSRRLGRHRKGLIGVRCPSDIGTIAMRANAIRPGNNLILDRRPRPNRHRPRPHIARRPGQPHRIDRIPLAELRLIPHHIHTPTNPHILRMRKSHRLTIRTRRRGREGNPHHDQSAPKFHYGIRLKR